MRSDFEHRAGTRPGRALASAGVLRHGDVVAGVRREGKRQPDQARLFGIEAGGFGVEAEGVQPLQGLDELRPLRRRGHQMILVRHIGNGLKIRSRRRRLGLRLRRPSLRLRHQHQLLSSGSPAPPQRTSDFGLRTSDFPHPAPP